MRPYYEDDYCTIWNADCRDILPTLGKVDLVLTDSPYGMNWDTSYSRFSKGSTDKEPIKNDETEFDPSFLLDVGCEIIMFGMNHFPQWLRSGSLLVWDKRNKDGTAFLSDGEVAWWSEGEGVYIQSISGQRHRSTSGGLHPTQKPVELMRWCIDKAKSGGTILDPFMGSGTTLVAAKQLGRKAIGIEMEEKYCEIAVKRLSQEYLAL